MSAAATVGVVHCGAGNLFSVLRGLRAVGASPEVVQDRAGLVKHDRLVLPGVGAFGQAMAHLREHGMLDGLHAHAAAGRPLLGICLGAQLLLDRSEEFGSHRGLGLIPGVVEAITPATGLRVPHVGWAALEPAAGGRAWPGTLLDTPAKETFAYFNHSFVMRPVQPAAVLAEIALGPGSVTAAVAVGPVVGVQFHPELSASPGLSMLEKFVSGT